jgi:hypothetical protein
MGQLVDLCLISYKLYMISRSESGKGHFADLSLEKVMSLPESGKGDELT